MTIPEDAVVHIKCCGCSREETTTWGKFWVSAPKVSGTNFRWIPSVQCECGGVAEVWACEDVVDDNG